MLRDMDDRTSRERLAQRMEVYVRGVVRTYIAHPDDTNGRKLDRALQTLQASQRQRALLQWQRRAAGLKSRGSKGQVEEHDRAGAKPLSGSS
jgi:hypothetical protein